MDTGEMPEGWIPVDAVAVIKALDEEGQQMYLIRSTSTLSDMEMVGMLTTAKDLQVAEINSHFIDEAEEEEG